MTIASAAVVELPTRSVTGYSSRKLSNQGYHPLREGDLLAGRYRIGELLGEGGYGRVLRATQLPLEREVAIKIVNAGDSELAARFVREAAIIRSLEHPNTVRVLDIGATPDGEPFLVLELLRGQDLDQLLDQRGRLPSEMALEITAQVLKSLAEAHEKGIVHRDIKPGNVFLTSHFGEPLFVKVLDFGIAKQLRSGDKLTAVGELLGTPSYMAPEQAMGLPIDARTDLYAVGLMLAEMVTGKTVFRRGGPMTIINAQAGPAPVALSGEVTASVIGPIVVRGVKKDPNQRYQSAAEMLRDVEAAQRSPTPVPAPVRGAATSASLGSAVTTATPSVAPRPRASSPVPPPPAVSPPTAHHGQPVDRGVPRPTVAQTRVGNLPANGAGPLKLPNLQAAAPIAPKPLPTMPPRVQHGGRQRALIIGMAAVIATLGAVVLLLVMKGGRTKDRAETDDDPEGAEEKRPTRARKPPSNERHVRSNQELKRVFAAAGYTVAELQQGPDDVSVYTFAVRKGDCAGAIGRMVSPNPEFAENQANALRENPTCQVFVDGEVLAYACTQSAVESRKPCDEGALKLLTR